MALPTLIAAIPELYERTITVNGVAKAFATPDGELVTSVLRNGSQRVVTKYSDK